MRDPGDMVIVALASVYAIALAGVFGFALGTSEPLPPPHAWEDSTRAVRWDIDVLQGQTIAGIEMCREAYAASPWTP